MRSKAYTTAFWVAGATLARMSAISIARMHENEPGHEGE